ncbi:MAG: histidine--tRNA ligase [Alphaproteobacteria bacterium]|nr:histidine--tRNA ligase [Alphaproteobacteria bacterium]
MSEKNKIYKPRPISGFPEWLPEVRRAEQMWFDHIRRVFEAYGFCSIETPSVEELDAINAKGGDGEADTDKEMYVIERLHKEEGDKEARLALHFDQTVPLARYTAQHFNELVFPFKRYQMQRVWRGERPQAGRFREFYQCDIDVINVDTLPLHFDAEMPAIIWEILSSLPGMEDEKIQIRISNRKILIGFLKSLGVTKQNDIDVIIRAFDKRDKIGEEQFVRIITEAFKKEKKMLHVIELIGGFSGIADRLKKHNDIDFEVCAAGILEITQDDTLTGEVDEMLTEGLEELKFVMKQLKHLPQGSIVADLSIVRGLDYYTGTVYETVFVDDPNYGSICSGGRYDDLASKYINKHLPGVGISIGFSRLFDRIRTQDKLPKTGISPADIMVVLPNEEQRGVMMETAQALRAQGYNVETFHSPSKIKRQMAYAEKKGIPYVWFPPFDSDSQHEVKNMETGDQSPADPKNWKKL